MKRSAGLSREAKHMHNFDEIINRTNTGSYKYDFHKRFNKPEGAIPLWVADMDFRIPSQVMDAIQKVADHGIYGYTDASEDYYKAVINWFEKRHNNHIKQDWIVKASGVVFALAMAIRGLTAPGDAIIIQKPLYPPIENSIRANNRVAIDSPLVYANGRYSIDFDDFEKKIIDNNVKMFILCSPHNPGGRVWLKDELLALGRICQKHNVLVVSDEIHCDIVYEGNKHVVFSTICEEFADFTVTCTAPSKTFNIAGLQSSNTIIPNKELRDRFTNEIWMAGVSQLNTMGLAACQAAYEHGGEWLDALMEYLTGNAAFVMDYLVAKTKIVPMMPQGSYLMWLDFNPLGIPHAKLIERLDNIKIWLSSGTDFGQSGAGFMRVNLACPRSVLQTAMERIVAEFAN